MGIDLIKKIKDKKEFRGLPDSIISIVLNNLESEGFEGDFLKESRAILRRYFGVFLTNKVVKPKNLMDYESILKSHKSSSSRDYSSFYKKLLRNEKFDVVFDFGCGVNGFSYPYLLDEFECTYIGVEASEVLVNNMNSFFKKERYNAKAIWIDLFDLKKVEKLLKSCGGRKLIFCFQLIDALEKLEGGYGLKFLDKVLSLMSKGDVLILSFPLKNLSGRRELAVKRNWVIDFLEDNAKIIRDFLIEDERFLLIETF